MEVHKVVLVVVYSLKMEQGEMAQLHIRQRVQDRLKLVVPLRVFLDSDSVVQEQVEAEADYMVEQHQHQAVVEVEDI